MVLAAAVAASFVIFAIVRVMSQFKCKILNETLKHFFALRFLHCLLLSFRVSHQQNGLLGLTVGSVLPTLKSTQYFA